MNIFDIIYNKITGEYLTRKELQESKIFYLETLLENCEKFKELFFGKHHKKISRREKIKILTFLAEQLTLENIYQEEALNYIWKEFDKESYGKRISYLTRKLKINSIDKTTIKNLQTKIHSFEIITRDGEYGAAQTIINMALETLCKFRSTIENAMKHNILFSTFRILRSFGLINEFKNHILEFLQKIFGKDYSHNNAENKINKLASSKDFNSIRYISDFNSLIKSLNKIASKHSTAQRKSKVK